MPLEITCRTCGKPYELTRAEILKGPDCYRVCADCRRAIQSGDAAAIFHRDPGDAPAAAELMGYVVSRVNPREGTIATALRANVGPRSVCRSGATREE